jgi:ketosteroid isomerase-like protein
MTFKTHTTMTILLKARTLPCLFFFLFSSFASIAQNSPGSLNLVEEIRKIEKQFENDLNKSGAGFAFEKYAAPNAVIKRQNDTLIIGPQAIKQYYSGDIYKTAKAFWSPDYIDVSRDGTMAYIYGKYRWIMTDQSGKAQEFSGIFHTVWKKQPDGAWKYVWD